MFWSKVYKIPLKNIFPSHLNVTSRWHFTVKFWLRIPCSDNYVHVMHSKMKQNCNNMNLSKNKSAEMRRLSQEISNFCHDFLNVGVFVTFNLSIVAGNCLQHCKLQIDTKQFLVLWPQHGFISTNNWFIIYKWSWSRSDCVWNFFSRFPWKRNRSEFDEPTPTRVIDFLPLLTEEGNNRTPVKQMLIQLLTTRLEYVNVFPGPIKV